MNDDIYTWQHSQWNHVTNLAKQDKLPHAMILYGIPGLGKNIFATQLVNYVLCERVTTDNAPCKQCANCRLMNAETHPDVTVIQPIEDSKIIKIDQIRTLTDFVYSKSYAGKYKIAVITPAEAMNIAAANALLKILEEPASDVLLILVANHLQWLPATVRSRCQTIYFPPLNLTQFQAYTQHNSALHYALSHGAPLRVCDEMMIEQRQLLFAGIMQLIQGSMSPVTLAQNVSQLEFATIVALLMSWFYDAVMMAQKIPATLLLNQDHVTELMQFCSKGNAFLYQCYDKLLALQNFLKQSLNINKQLWLEDFFVGLVGVD